MPLCHVAYHDMCGCFTCRTRMHQVTNSQIRQLTVLNCYYLFYKVVPIFSSF